MTGHQFLFDGMTSVKREILHAAAEQIVLHRLAVGMALGGILEKYFSPSNISLVTWALYLPQFRFPRSGQTHRPLHYPELELDVLLHKEPTRTQVDGANVTFESLIPRIRKSS